jgi:hypothetical protein
MHIVDDASVQPPHCTTRFSAGHAYGYAGPDYSFGDCGNPVGFVYVALYKLVVQYLLLSLCVG